MNLPKLHRRCRGRRSHAIDRSAPPGLTIDEHMERSQLAQRQADKWLISGIDTVVVALSRDSLWSQNIIAWHSAILTV